MSLPAGSRDPQVRSGSVALVGWTNVGKSTLLNRLVGEKLAAVSKAPQTTRVRVLGVAHLSDGSQIAFVDTPGFHQPRHRLNHAMINQANRSLSGVDLVVLVVDAARGMGAGDRNAADRVVRSGAARLLVLNKIDQVRPKSRLLLMMQIAEEWGFPAACPISALTGEGCDVLVREIVMRLPVAAPLFEADYLTDQTERALAAEWIREKLLARTRQELPHATAVTIDSWQEREAGGVAIEATILVERESQKPIVIGRGGQMLKEVGSAARLEIERLLGRRVHLSLWVKVRSNWRDDDRLLEELGLR